jgi:hypothetical protein
MMDWRVLGEEEGLPSLPGEEEPRAGRVLARLWPWLLLLLVLGLALGAAVVWQARQREARLHADLAAIVEEEARAQAFGVPEQASTLADPLAPESWRQRYGLLFREERTPLRPEIAEMEFEEERALLTVTWPEARTPITERRAYRLVDGAWRRAPLPLQAWEPAGEQSTDHFLLRADAADLEALTGDPALRLNLERLRGRVVTYWPHTWKDFFLTVTAQPQELSGPVYFADAQKLFVNSPPLALADPTSPLPWKAQYRLAVTSAVVEWLTTPEWLRQPFTESNDGLEALLPEEEQGLRNWVALWRILQQAEARQWALDGEQRVALRNGWREELGGVWPEPFAGPLPLDPDAADPEARRRWMAVSLLVERQIQIEGIHVPGRLATVLLDYPARNDFQVGQFFGVLIGGSANNVEQLSRDYILTPEPLP